MKVQLTDSVVATSIVAVSLILLAAVFGCSDGDGPTRSIASPLAVVSIAPQDSLDNVSVHSSVVVTFNRDIDSTTITDSSFMLTSADGAGLVDGAIVTWTPTEPLAPGAEYTVTLSA